LTQLFRPEQSAGSLSALGLSTAPLQSLSRQSQTSTATEVPPAQMKLPLVQSHFPGEHSPSFWPQGSPMAATGGGVGFCVPSMLSGPTPPCSSICPSQSLSMPSQISGEGPTPPMQRRPPMPLHWETPGWQGEELRSPG
jgi:hypothetical protein